MMHIGLAQWCLAETVTDAIEVCHRVGCHVLHAESGIMDSDYWLGNLENRTSALDCLAQYNIHCVALSANELCETGLIHPPQSLKGKQAWEITRTTIDIAAAMEIPLVVLPSFFDGTIVTEADLENTTHQLAHAAEYARTHAIKIVSENGLATYQQQALVANIPSLQVLFDTQNPLVFGHDAQSQLRDLGHHFCDIVHIKDGSKDVFGDRTLLDGITPLSELVTQLKTQLKPQYWIIETEYVEIDGDIDSLIKQDMMILRELWNVS